MLVTSASAVQNFDAFIKMMRETTVTVHLLTFSDRQQDVLTDFSFEEI